MKLAEKRRRSERARELEIVAMAFRSEGKEITARMRRDWDS